MEYKLWQLCCDIIDIAYKDVDENIKKKYKHVFFEVSNKEMSTFHGDYSWKDKKIRIFNLSRDNESTLCTSLPELAHHIDHVNRGQSDHSKEFYEVYKQLIKAALEMSLITKVQILSLKRDASDTNKVKKIVDELEINTIETYKKDRYVIKVNNCFSIKNQLKNMQYKWNGLSKVWEKEVNKLELDNEKEQVEQLIDSDNVEIVEANKITFDCFSNILVLESYDYKDELKKKGYHYDSTQRGWIKKFNNKEIEEEVNYLNKMGLKKVYIKN